MALLRGLLTGLLALAAASSVGSAIQIPLSAIFAGRSASSDDGEPFGRTTACATKCPEPSTAAYQSRMVHVYDYHSSAKVFGGIQEPQLAVTARVHITVDGPCEMILALSHVRLTGTSTSSTEFAAALTSTPLRFAFHDGRISNICPSTEEPIWVLNFKRAVLSTFQNSMSTLSATRPELIEEEDVSGTCKSTYSSTQLEAGVYNITRVRSENCISRPVPPTNNKLTSLMQLLPVFDKEQTCHQKFSAGVLTESFCREYIRYPNILDSPDRLPVIAITTSLSAAYQFRADFVVTPNYNATRASLLQDWDAENMIPPNQWMEIVQDIYQQFQTIKPSPSVFYDLTEVLKKLNYDQIQNLFIDTMPELWSTAAMSFLGLGSEPAMKLMVDFMTQDVLSSSKLSDIVEYLAMRYEVISPMLDLLERVIENDKSNHVALTKVKNYCLSNSTCEEDERTSSIFQIVSDYATPKCKSAIRSNSNSSSDYDDYSYGGGYSDSYQNIEYLNTIRDLGHWNENTSLAIDECVQSNISEVSYAAIEALRRSPCDQFDYSALLIYWQNPSLDNYTQVMVYKALARCPSQMLTATILQKLLIEDVTQVTSYIWSHVSNFEEESWTSEILNDARLRSKYAKEKLKFSRHFRKDFVISNKTFHLEIDSILSGYNPSPQYISFRISTKEFEPRDIFEFERREKNVTRRASSGYYGYSNEESGVGEKYETKTYYLTNVRLFGFTMYDKEISKDASSFYTLDEIYMSAISIGYRIASKLTIEYLYQYFSRISSASYFKKFDIQLRYPTSIGMPINLKFNMTHGSHEGTVLLSYAKNFDAQLSLDATHAQIGSRMQATYEFLPRLKADLSGKKIKLRFGLPEAKTQLLNFDYAAYTFENDYLSPKFYDNETSATNMCIPGLLDATGFTICLDYYPRTRYWPIYVFNYGISYLRDPKLEGIDISYNSNSRNNMQELSVETPGSPSNTWRITKYELGQFLSVNLTTPFFVMNGSGIYRDDVIFFRESGQAVNMSGLFNYKNSQKEAVPFLLISDFTVNEKAETKTVNINFESSLLSTKVGTSFKSGDNLTLVVSIPYKFQDENNESFKIAAAQRRFSISSSRRHNYETSALTNFIRSIYSASFGFSKYRRPLLTVEAIHEEGGDVDTCSVTVEVQGSDSSLSKKTSFVLDDKYFNGNCTLTYEDTETNAIWNKQLVHGENASSSASSFVMNNDTIYSFEVRYENDTGKGLYSNATFLVPNNDINAEYPIFVTRYEQGFNFTDQLFYIRCNKSYHDTYLWFNATATQVPFVRTSQRQAVRSTNYNAGLEIFYSRDDPFRISASTALTPNEQDSNFVLDVNVVSPFDRWHKDALDVKVEKKDKYLKATLTDKRKTPEKIYSTEGVLDYDIITNMIDYTDRRMGRPSQSENEI